MTVFRRHGFRRSSIEETAEAAGLTRQALYHHFKSKEALFRAVIERVHDGALADGAAAAERVEAAGGSLADIVIAQVAARLKAFVASFDGSPHVDELFSEHLIHARDLYQHYAALHDAQVAATIARTVKRERLALAPGMTAGETRALCRTGRHRHQIRLSLDAPGRRLSARRRGDAAHADRGRRRAIEDEEDYLIRPSRPPQSRSP